MAKLSVIGQLNRMGSLTPTELANQEGVKIQTLTRMLAELEREGWLTRAPHEADGRQSLLSLTAGGKKRLKNAAQAKDAGLAEIIKTTLTTDEQALLMQACILLDRLDTALSKKTEPSQAIAEERQ